MEQACTIYIKGYICVIVAVIRRFEADIDVEGQLKFIASLLL